EVMDNVAAAYGKLRNKIAELKDDGAVDRAKFEEFDAKFREAVGNDLNTSMAITCIYDVLRDDMNDGTKRELLKSFDKVLSLDLFAQNVKAEVDGELEAYVLSKIEERKAAKKEKNFARADEIRSELLEKGIIIEDTREGVRWRKQ
ncbi:MAG: hypothetical protein NC086_03935, partial [Alistipes sp.]|nr:hypothetical protein [Alistipes sp.]